MTTTETRLVPTNHAMPYIANKLGFRTHGNLWASRYGSSYGRLVYERTTAFQRAQEADDFYAVFSYQTPIAWYAHGVWTVPDVKYSVTTTKHQNIVREAVNYDRNR